MEVIMSIGICKFCTRCGCAMEESEAAETGNKVHMEKRKMLIYDWKYGHEELVLQVASYTDRNGLYIGLYNSESGEEFSDLTINLPHEDVGYAEAYIDDFKGADILFIKFYKLGKVLPECGHLDGRIYKKVLLHVIVSCKRYFRADM